jgi:hypothetical protein
VSIPLVFWMPMPTSVFTLVESRIKKM